jgi:hypothetical protein
VDRWTTRGDRLGTSYHWPEGYRVEAETPVTFHDVRMETLKRVTVYETEQDMVEQLLQQTNGKRRSTR